MRHLSGRRDSGTNQSASNNARDGSANRTETNRCGQAAGIHSDDGPSDDGVPPSPDRSFDRIQIALFLYTLVHGRLTSAQR